MRTQALEAIPEIEPEEAFSSIDRFRLVDVRNLDEFDGPLGFIEGAELLGRLPLEEQCRSFCASPALLLICRSGRRSAEACSYLRKNGAENVMNLRGGMIAWNRAGLPICRKEISTLQKLKDSIVAWVGLVTAATSNEARGQVDALLLEAGASVDVPTVAALNYVLDELSNRMAEVGAPPDLNLVIDAYRRDLVAL